MQLTIVCTEFQWTYFFVILWLDAVYDDTIEKRQFTYGVQLYL